MSLNSIEVLPSDRQIEDLYFALVSAEKEADAAILGATQKYYDLGEALLQVRASFKRGEWLPYLEARGIHKKRAERAQAIAKKFHGRSDRLSLLSINQALEQARLPAVEEHLFEEVESMFAAIDVRFYRQRNGSFRYVLEYIGKTMLLRSTDEAAAQFDSIKQLLERRDLPTCDRCRFSEAIADGWYCSKHGQNYSETEDRAPTCEQYQEQRFGGLSSEVVEHERAAQQLLDDMAAPIAPVVELPSSKAIAATSRPVPAPSAPVAQQQERPDRLAQVLDLLALCKIEELEVVADWVSDRLDAVPF